MTGRELIGLILPCAALCGVMVHHEPDSRALMAGCARGWPDLVLAGPNGVLFREVKGSNDRLSPAQMEWGAVLLGAGLDWGRWRPDDWDQRIPAEIRAIGGPGQPTR